MRKIYFFALIVFCFSAGRLHASEGYSFSISADVEKSATISLPESIVMDFIKNLDIYPKYFPDIVSVKKINDKDSEWQYRIKAPLASPYNLTFVLEDKSPTKDTLLFESVDSVRDYLYCKGVFDSLGESQTKVTLRFHIKMTREKASEVHFMAGILGEKFLSDRMREKLDSDMDTFISSVTKEMYLENRDARGN